jgi:MoxR-like ATPase
LDLVTLIAPGKLRQVEDAIETSIRGKKEAVRMALVCLLARGHLLIEDVPGVGKTTLGQSLARSVDGSFHRLQFTSDMLPSDVLGVTVFNSHTEEFEFKPGPIFTNFLLADEINRTTPKTQSALLEAMNEQQVSIEGRTLPLPEPFMVIATQNPADHHGTYPLP